MCSSDLPAGGFPGGAVVKNMPANAGDTGSNPGRGAKILHATWHSQENFKKKKEKKSGLGKHASKGCRLRWADTAISGKFQKAKLEIAMHWQQFM